MYCIALRGVRFKLVVWCFMMGSFVPFVCIPFGSDWDIRLDRYTTHLIEYIGSLSVAMLH